MSALEQLIDRLGLGFLRILRQALFWILLVYLGLAGWHLVSAEQVRLESRNVLVSDSVYRHRTWFQKLEAPTRGPLIPARAFDLCPQATSANVPYSVRRDGRALVIIATCTYRYFPVVYRDTRSFDNLQAVASLDKKIAGEIKVLLGEAKAG